MTPKVIKIKSRPGQSAKRTFKNTFGTTFRAALEKGWPSRFFSRKKNYPQDEFMEEQLDLDTPFFQLMMREISHSPKAGFNTILIGAFSLLGLAVTGFTAIPLPNAIRLSVEYWFSSHSAFISSMPSTVLFSPQLSFSIFCGALLGQGLGVVLMLCYLVIGLTCLPVFAGGGGLIYFSQPGMGYLLGMLIAAYGAGKRFNRYFSWQSAHRPKPRGNSLQLLFISLNTVLTIHFIGALYLAGLAITGIISWPALGHWLLHLSLEPLPYDILLTSILIVLVRWARLLLWAAIY